MIQPHVPIRLPCGDLTLLTEPRFGYCITAISSKSNLFGLTGSVCKEQESIHRALLKRGYYGFRLHEAELQTSIRTRVKIRGLAPPFGVASYCLYHCNSRVAQRIRVVLTYRRPRLPLSFESSLYILLVRNGLHVSKYRRGSC